MAMPKPSPLTAITVVDKSISLLKPLAAILYRQPGGLRKGVGSFGLVVMRLRNTVLSCVAANDSIVSNRLLFNDVAVIGAASEANSTALKIHAAGALRVSARAVSLFPWSPVRRAQQRVGPTVLASPVILRLESSTKRFSARCQSESTSGVGRAAWGSRTPYL